MERAVRVHPAHGDGIAGSNRVARDRRAQDILQWRHPDIMSTDARRRVARAVSIAGKAR
jgi:hypothetical protein